MSVFVDNPVQHVDISMLTQHPKNIEIYGDEDVTALKQSIAESGWIKPLTVTPGYVIISGHRRYLAAKQLGYTELPIEIETFASPEAEMERLLRENENRGKTPEQQIREGMTWEPIEKAKAEKRQKSGMDLLENFPEGGNVRDIIARRVGLGSGKTYEHGKTVVERIDYLERLDIFLEEAGALRITLNDQSINAAKKMLDTMQKAREDAEERARIKQEEFDAAVKRKLEDEARRAKVLPRLEQSSYDLWLPNQGMCDLLITDPPYSSDIDDITSFAQAWLPLALSKVKDSGRAYVCIGAYPQELQAYLNVPVPSHLRLANVLVWTYKNTLGPSPTYDYKLNWQAILYFVGTNAPPLDCPLMTEQFSVQEINAPDGRMGDRYHTWQKPMDLAKQLIRHSTKLDDVVFDCFAGTGTFLLAASSIGRISRGCDCSEQMIQIAEQRGCEVSR